MGLYGKSDSDFVKGIKARIALRQKRKEEESEEYAEAYHKARIRALRGKAIGDAHKRVYWKENLVQGLSKTLKGFKKKGGNKKGFSIGKNIPPLM